MASAKRRKSNSNLARTSSGSKSAKHSASSRTIDPLEKTHCGAVAAFEKLDLLRERTKRIRNAVLFREQVQSVADAPVVAPIVDDKPVGFALGRAVHARDGLQKRVLAQRSIKIEHLFNRRVEARQKHIADDQYLQGIVRLLETGDAIIPLALR